MSARTYAVEIQLKDNGLLKKLEAFSGGSGSSGGGGGGTVAGGGSIFNKLESLGVGQLLKLTGIGIGIGQLVNLTIKSSGMLQGVFKLWETGFMLVFKPFGDFIALALRPLTLAMLTQLIIPFYKHVYPFFRDYGTKVGEALSAGFFPEYGFEDSPVGKGLEAAGLAWDFYMQRLGQEWDKFVTGLSTTLGNVPLIVFAVFGTLATNLSQWFVNIPSFLGDVFLRLGQNIWNWLTNVPQLLSDVFTGLANNLISTLSSIPEVIYNAIVGWIEDLKKGAISGSASTGIGASIAASRTITQAVADTNP